MNILVDENIPFAAKVLSSFGDINPVPGRALRESDLASAEVMIIRSVTRVDRDLIAKAPRLRFVGSCTIGTDHIDLNALSGCGIAFAHAPGCNANSVAEYVLSVLLNQPEAMQRLLAGDRLGIVGMGNVGRAVARTMGCLGIACSYYDPLLTESEQSLTSASRVDSLDDIMRLPVVSCHTPLTKAGPHPSYHMLNLERLSALPESALLINAGRGDLMSNDALHGLLDARPDVHLALDVWPEEPAIDLELLARCVIATPHIAGYSQEGKVQGLLQVAAQMADELGLARSEVGISDLLGVAGQLALAADDESSQHKAMLSAYDVSEDDRRMRAAMAGIASDASASGAIAQTFDRLRKSYPVRRELRGRSITGFPQAQPLAALCSR